MPEDLSQNSTAKPASQREQGGQQTQQRYVARPQAAGTPRSEAARVTRVATTRHQAARRSSLGGQAATAVAVPTMRPQSSHKDVEPGEVVIRPAQTQTRPTQAPGPMAASQHRSQAVEAPKPTARSTVSFQNPLELIPEWLRIPVLLVLALVLISAVLAILGSLAGSMMQG